MICFPFVFFSINVGENIKGKQMVHFDCCTWSKLKFTSPLFWTKNAHEKDFIFFLFEKTFEPRFETKIFLEDQPVKV
jgi:hypothetical protein